MSARPGPGGGYRATGIPTAILHPGSERNRLFSTTITSLRSASGKKKGRPDVGAADLAPGSVILFHRL